tara:strand:- start:1076 stop:1984 length:909 start_codon:yes stop_codon:yes gene_type:complete
MQTLWVEKYRPSILSEIIGQDNILAEFKEICKGAPMQHFLFHSPEAGTGKTSLARVLAKELGYEIHQFNASSKKQRGIDFIEEDLIPLASAGFAETIFLLDEADQLTPAAQSALKGVIENSTGYFILTCNDLSKVSRWLKSRCQLRNFKPISQEAMLSTLESIAGRESISITVDDAKTICSKHAGDLRNAIGALQAYAYMDERNRSNFILSLGDAGINSKRFLRLCFKERSAVLAFGELDLDKPRDSVHEVFRFATESEASQESKMKVIEASITTIRDLINGVEPEICLWNFVRILCGSAGS